MNIIIELHTALQLVLSFSVIDIEVLSGQILFSFIMWEGLLLLTDVTESHFSFLEYPLLKSHSLLLYRVRKFFQIKNSNIPFSFFWSSAIIVTSLLGSISWKSVFFFAKKSSILNPR